MRCFTRIYDFFYNNDVQLEDGLSLEEGMHILEKSLDSDGSDSEDELPVVYVAQPDLQDFTDHLINQHW